MKHKYIKLLLILCSFLFSDEYTAYVRQIEMSFCMDECAEYYLETESGTYIYKITRFI